MSFKRDLVIATWDADKQKKVLYQIPESEWRTPDRLADDDLAADLEAMLGQGTILAAVPEGGGAIGVACYLVNLASIDVNPWKVNADPNGKSPK